MLQNLVRGKVPPRTLHISVSMPHRDKTNSCPLFSDANFTNGPECGQPSPTFSSHGNSRWLPETRSSCDIAKLAHYVNGVSR